MNEELPNIILVVFDTARRDRFGCYGARRGTTPTVDSLARQGLRVETMIANGPWTLPSHGSLFTGLYPTEHGSQWRTGPQMRRTVPVTLAEWLGGMGYDTVCATNNGLISERTGLARGFKRYAFRLDLERGWRRVARRTRKVLGGGDSGGRVVNAWLRRELPLVRKPLFLFVNYVECHWAYAPPRRLQRRAGGPRFSAFEDLRYRVRLADRVGPWEAVARADERTLDIYAAMYDAEHLNVDGHLAELLDILERTGQLPDGRTILIVTSDHGEHIGEHGLADHHASVDDHLIRVPFVAWGPGIVPSGEREGLYEFVDVFPSLARLLDRELPGAHLEDRRADLFDRGPEPKGNGGYAFAEWRSWSEKELARLSRRNPSYDFSGLARDLACVRDLRFKLVRSSEGGDTLYDLASDPDERIDVRRSHPDDARRLAAALDAAVASWSSWELDQEALSDSEAREIEERLSALGYI